MNKTLLTKKTFVLGSSLAQCPVYWQNFIIHLQKQTGNLYRDVRISILQKELKVYGRRYHMAGSERWGYIEFNTEKQFILFALRWA
jgi:hypothetical protein